MIRISLEPYFLHQEQVLGLLGTKRATAALARMTNIPSAIAPYILATTLAEALPVLGVGELQKAVYERTLKAGQVVGVEQTFLFRRAKERDKPADKPVDFHAQLNTDTATTLSGSFNSTRFTAASASGNLSGRKHAYLIGTVISWDSNKIELRPAFVGIRSFIEDEEVVSYGGTSNRRTYPGQVDQFTTVDFGSSVSADELKAVLSVPEEAVKTSFAAMIGEAYVHKDWGGERSDLYTSRLQVQGRQISSAWIFKGPGYPHPMTVRALGKPGDQIVRLFSEPAELLVLQHCHEITPAVINMMETYAHDLRNPRRYMIIDGTDTARILKTQGVVSPT